MSLSGRRGVSNMNDAPESGAMHFASPCSGTGGPSSHPRLSVAARIATAPASQLVLSGPVGVGATSWSVRPAVVGETKGPKTSHIAFLVRGPLSIVGSVTPWVSFCLFGHTVSLSETGRAI